MLTKIKDFRALLEKKKMEKSDMFVVGFVKSSSEKFNDKYVEELEKLCGKFARVYQLLDMDVSDEPIELPNQTGTYKKCNTQKPQGDEIDMVFMPSVAEEFRLKDSNYTFQVGDRFDTNAGESYVYTGEDREWFLCDRALRELLEGLAEQDRDVVIVGDTDEDVLIELSTVLRSYGISAEIDAQYVFGADGCKFVDDSEEVKAKKKKKADKEKGLDVTSKNEGFDPADRPLGKSLADQINTPFITIYRACSMGSNEFVDRDYVTTNKKFAIIHAESTHVYQEEQQHVIRALVPTKNVFDALNPGEYFYSGPNKKGTEIYKTLGPDEFEGIDESIEYYPGSEHADVKGYVDGDVAKLNYVKVKPSKRGTGSGKLAVTDFEDWAKAMGAKKIKIDAYKTSVGFWDKMGYDIEDEFPVIDGHKQDYKSGVKQIREGMKNKGPRGKDLSTFVRFGGLDLKRQDGYSKDQKTFHAPPAPRGFYAMPKVAQELFLVGSIASTQPGIFPKSPKYPEHKEINDELSPEDQAQWDKDSNEFDWDKHQRSIDKRYQEIRKEFKKTDGMIWHHLADFVPNNEVDARHGSWVKTTMATWRKAFNKASLNSRYGSDSFASKDINKTKGIYGYYAKDDLEVFFDEKV